MVWTLVAAAALILGATDAGQAATSLPTRDAGGWHDIGLSHRESPVAEARRALVAQAASMGAHDTLATSPAHDSLGAAVRALVQRHGVVTPDVDAKLASLDALSEARQRPLTRVVDAYLAFDEAAARRVELARVQGLGAGLPELLAARTALFDAASALSAMPAIPGFSAPLQLPPWFSLSLGIHDDVYSIDFALVIDEGGNDVYGNNAGGSNLHGGLCRFGAAVPSPAAALFDLAGSDQYTSLRSCGANGGGSGLGAGFLYDAGVGGDSYWAGDFGVNGGGNFGGVGFLYDEAGVSTYQAGSTGTNGGASLGVGLLVDGAGSDDYIAGGIGANGGSSLGSGALVDLGGSDEYRGGGIGVNGGANGGTGLLLDANGNDLYAAASAAVNGGGGAGLALLLDRGGFDSYSDLDGGSGTNRTVVPKGVVGAQVDAPG